MINRIPLFIQATIFFVVLSSSKCNNVEDVVITKGGSLPLASQWILSSFENKSNFEISKSTYINISEDYKSYEGNGGCNMMSGLVKVAGNNIKFESSTMTKMACNILAQEQLFIQNLSAIDNYKIEDGEMFLYQGSKKLMTLESWR